MYVELTKNNGIDYLRLVKSQRVTNSKGVRTSTKKVVMNIGPLSRFDDGQPDYVKRLKQSFKEGHPLIEALLPYVEKNMTPEAITVSFIPGDDSCFGHPQLFAPCILDKVFSSLGLDELFASIKHGSRIQYDLQGIVRLLTYGRILHPASKIETMRQNREYYQPLVKSTNDDNVYDALDMIYDNRRQIVQRMNSRISNGIGRNTSNVYYDVTNFFFEVEEPDRDELDEDGNVLAKGTRKKGVSKENRKQPIVQMGLFLDDNGIPVSIEMFPGNTLDHLTLRDAMRNTVDTLGLDRFILVADRGMYSGTNMCHVLNQGNGYIVSKSLKKSSRKEREWLLDPEGYTVVSDDFRYKSHTVVRTVTDEDGSKRKIEEKIVAYWSRAFYERERHENKSFLEFIEKLKTAPHTFRITATQSRSIRKFLKKDMVHKETGEILDSRKLLTMIDEEKLNEYNEMMGYYQIASSELDMDDLEIIEKYHGLTRIEDQFREMKGTLETRPIYVRTKKHIHAHLLICFMALTMMRVMQHKIRNVQLPEVSNKKQWSYGLPGERLSKALRSWKVDMLPGELYRMQGVLDEDLQIIFKALELSIPAKLFTRGELRSLRSSIQIF